MSSARAQARPGRIFTPGDGNHAAGVHLHMGRGIPGAREPATVSGLIVAAHGEAALQQIPAGRTGAASPAEAEGLDR